MTHGIHRIHGSAFSIQSNYLSQFVSDQQTVKANIMRKWKQIQNETLNCCFWDTKWYIRFRLLQENHPGCSKHALIKGSAGVTQQSWSQSLRGGRHDTTMLRCYAPKNSKLILQTKHFILHNHFSMQNSHQLLKKFLHINKPAKRKKVSAHSATNRQSMTLLIQPPSSLSKPNLESQCGENRILDDQKQQREPKKRFWHEEID